MIQCWFDRACDTVEHWFSTWWGVGAYALLCVVAYQLWGWDGLDRWVYMSGAATVILLIGSGRRDSKATHVKLDSMTDGTALDRLEERREDEIEASRAG